MNPNLSFDPAAGNPLTVDSPITLRLRAGSAVFAVRGVAWITQDGRPQDVILGAGERFDVPARAPLVISATRDRVELYVAHPAAARLSAACNVHDFLHAQAAQLRRAEAARLFDGLLHGVCALVSRARATLAPRTRLPTH